MNTIKIMLPFRKNYRSENNSKPNADNATLSPQNRKVLTDIIRANKKALSRESRFIYEACTQAMSIFYLFILPFPSLLFILPPDAY